MRQRTKRARGGARNSGHGFTLIELLVATGVTVVLAMMLISITTGLLQSWNQSRGRLTSANQAKVALDQLAEDLEGLVLRSDGNVWLAATISRPQTGNGDAGISDASYPNSTGEKCKPSANSTVLLPGSGDLEDYRFGHVGVWLRFFTHQPAANDGVGTVSSIRAVAYQIARVHVGSSGGNPRRYFLYRSSVRPGPFDFDGDPIAETASVTHSTLTTGYDIVGSNSYNTENGQEAANLLEPFRIRKPLSSQIIGNDVIDFGVRIYTRTAAGDLVERFPADRSAGPPTDALWAFLATTDTTAQPVNPSEGPSSLIAAPVHAMPAVVEIMMRVLTNQGSQMIQALETGAITPPGGSANYDDYWWEVALANSHVYTRRVELKGEPY